MEGETDGAGATPTDEDRRMEEDEEEESGEEQVQMTQTKTKTGKYPCIKCGKPATKKSVQCTTCRLWVHADCQKISKELFSILANPAKHGGGNVCWNCDSCKAGSARLEARMVAMEVNFKEVENRVIRNEGLVQENNKRVDTVEKKQGQLEERMEKQQETYRKEMIEEMREREIRKRNVVMHRVEEAGDWARTAEEEAVGPGQLWKHFSGPEPHNDERISEILQESGGEE